MSALRMKPSPFNPELELALKEAAAWFDALTPEQQKEHRRAQRKSWVIGELMLSYPDMTREQAERAYESASE